MKLISEIPLVIGISSNPSHHTARYYQVCQTQGHKYLTVLRNSILTTICSPSYLFRRQDLNFSDVFYGIDTRSVYRIRIIRMLPRQTLRFAAVLMGVLTCTGDHLLLPPQNFPRHLSRVEQIPAQGSNHLLCSCLFKHSPLVGSTSC